MTSAGCCLSRPSPMIHQSAKSFAEFPARGQHSMTASNVRRSFSVSQRLWTLGGAAFIGVAAMVAVGVYENTQTSNALHRANATQDIVDDVSAMRLAAVDLVLATMDTIVDR